jgi:anthranilate phosphoribosyltransferase
VLIPDHENPNHKKRAIFKNLLYLNYINMVHVSALSFCVRVCIRALFTHKSRKRLLSLFDDECAFFFFFLFFEEKKDLMLFFLLFCIMNPEGEKEEKGRTKLKKFLLRNQPSSRARRVCALSLSLLSLSALSALSKVCSSLDIIHFPSEYIYLPRSFLLLLAHGKGKGRSHRDPTTSPARAHVRKTHARYINIMSSGSIATTTTTTATMVSSSSSRKFNQQKSSSATIGRPTRRTTPLRTSAASSIKTYTVNAAQKEVNLQKVIENLCEGKDLSEDEAFEAMEALLDASENQIAAFLVLLRAKGETSSEMAGLARAMQSRALQVNAGDDVLDIVGTGGDSAGTVNISTGSCVLAAAAGAKVAKHGSRSVSSLCGSADVLEALGVAVEIGPEAIEKCVKEVGMGFMFAPRFHPAMAKVSPVRKSLKVRTAFNLLGPMLNPAHSKYALVGVYSTGIQKLMADSFMRLGMKKALIVHSMGLDELTPCGPADVMEVSKDGVKTYTFEPSKVGIKKCELKDLAGGDAQLNAKILREALGGETGPVAETLILNAGVAMAAAEQAASVEEGIAMCREAHKAGKGGEKLDSWVQLTQECAKAGL